MSALVAQPGRHPGLRRQKLYAAAGTAERRKLFDAYVATTAWSAGQILALLEHLGTRSTADRSSPTRRAPHRVGPAGVVDLYGYPKSVKGEDGSHFGFPPPDNRARLVAEGLIFDSRERIDRACRDYLAGKTQEDMARACLQRLVGRGYDDDREVRPASAARRRGKRDLDVEILGSLGWTPLHVAVGRYDPDRLRAGLAPRLSSPTTPTGSGRRRGLQSTQQL